MSPSIIILKSIIILFRGISPLFLKLKKKKIDKKINKAREAQLVERGLEAT
jgi:hypothetical protein